MSKIKHIINLGRRCNSEQFLEKYKLKKYCTPFSSIFCDFETSIFYIKNHFIGFLNNKKICKHNYKQLDNWRLAPTFFYNYDIIKDFKDKDNINDFERVLIWTHYNPISERELIDRRCERVLNILKNNNSNSILYFYVDKIRKITELDKVKNNILDIVNKYNIQENIIYIIPCENYNEKCKKFFENNNVNIYILNVTPIDRLDYETKRQNKLRPNGRPILDADIDDINNDFDCLYLNLQRDYEFNV